ncbi:MAG: Stealth CR1 domain-containing protein [Clostridiales bacterium]|nr:Stealth CR1 domain-containing protein [Candidatus Equinaster intestinalis]
MQNFPIDFVLMWVDGNDAEWKKLKSQYDGGVSEQANADNRFRDWDLLKYWFRAVEFFTPWVNSVYFVTCGHYPEWLNLDAPKLKFVKHSEFIPEEYLPTFSSHPIELNLHRLPGLSENFVLFNDDVFILKPLKEEAFFKSGLPNDVFIQSFNAPVKGAEVMCNISYNDLEVINSHYSKFDSIKRHPFKYFSLSYGADLLQNIYAFPIKLTGLKALHSAFSYNKKTFENLWEAEYERLSNTCKHKFRDRSDVNQWVFSWDQIMRGYFSPINPKKRKYFTIGDSNAISTILKQSADIVCLNDGNMNVDFEFEKERLIKAFEKILPNKSSFEV